MEGLQRLKRDDNNLSCDEQAADGEIETKKRKVSHEDKPNNLHEINQKEGNEGDRLIQDSIIDQGLLDGENQLQYLDSIIGDEKNLNDKKHYGEEHRTVTIFRTMKKILVQKQQRTNPLNVRILQIVSLRLYILVHLIQTPKRWNRR